MLFKKNKNTQIITLGISQAYVPGVVEKSPPPVQIPAEEHAPETEILAVPAAIPSPIIADIPEGSSSSPEPPARVGNQPVAGVTVAAGPSAPPDHPEPEPSPILAETPSPAAASLSPEEPAPPAPHPPKPEEDLNLEVLPVFEAEEVVETTQCPFCLSNVPALTDICPNCGNQMHEPAPPPDVPPAITGDGTIEEAVPAMEIETSIQIDEILPEATRKLGESPTPAILRETTLFLPASLSLMDETDKVFTLTIGANVLGREQSNDLAFPDEEFISRHHCEIRYHKYQYLLKDLNSANGTFVNDVRVQETTLRDGDVVQIGSLRFLFEDPMEKMKKKKAAQGKN